jgi:sugar lactone lactonase YvrE/enterochelin esterase-like enzyme
MNSPDSTADSSNTPPPRHGANPLKMKRGAAATAATAAVFAVAAAAAIALAFPAAAAPGGPEITAGPYQYGPDSQLQPGTPQGREEPLPLPTSKIFSGADHDCWVYVPAQYKAEKPACVMVFQDGGGYLKRDGAWRVPVVFDNLIHKGEMPVTIGIFINPGVVKAAQADALPRFNRSFEYDGLGDAYVRFLLDEVFPEVRKKWNLSDNPDDRAIAGASSGAICAFTAAWERPDAFRRVFSTIGTYVGLRGGNDYPTLIRKTEPKPLRVFLQDGVNDLNIYGGDWWMANQEMQRSLTFSGYEVSHLWGDTAHDSKQAGPALPDGLRWLWKDHGKSPVAAHPAESKQPVAQWCDLSQGWELVSQGHGNTEGPCANAKGEIFFTDSPNNKIWKVSADGKPAVFAENTDGADGLALGPDGRLYATTKKNTIVAFDESGAKAAVASGFAGNDLVVAKTGGIYVTEFNTKKVWFIPPGGSPRVADEGIARPNGVALSPDQTLLYVADTAGQFIYSFQVAADGSLRHKQPYFHLHLPDNSPSNADGLCVDAEGRLYVASAAGVQICDQAGRVNAILTKPQPGWLSNVDFGGAGLDFLYATAHDKVFRRKMKVKGFRYADGPFKPQAPRL